MSTLAISRRLERGTLRLAGPALALLAAWGCGPGGSGPPSSPTVPAAIEALGYHGENTYEFARAGDWAGARAALDSLVSGTRGLRQVAKAGADVDSVLSAVSLLDRAVTLRQQFDAMSESNRLTRLGAELARAYHPREPTEVAVLDFYGRELEIGVAANDVSRLRLAATGIHESWKTLRPTVLGYDGADEAARFDDLVARLDAARARSDFVRLSMSAIADVYGLQQLFAP